MAFTRLEWAQWMAGKGLAVFAAQPNSRKPLAGISWYVRQSPNPEEVSRYFEETPDCNYGVYPGEKYVVVDLDVKSGKNGVAAFEKICAANGVESFLWDLDTLIVKSPSGGYHVYFQAPFPCANKHNFPEGIDVRGVGGYVIGPGSKIGDNEYEVLDPDAPIAPLPEWLVEYMVEPGHKDPNAHIPLIEWDLPENLEYAKEWLKHREPAIEGQGGDSWTVQTIFFVRDFGVSEEMALELIHDWNMTCDPPWDIAELEGKVRNAYAYPQNRAGVKAPTYKVERHVGARPAGGYGSLISEQQLAELFNPTRHLKLIVNNDEDSDIPDDVVDDGRDPVTGEVEETKNIWHDVLDFAAQPAVREYVISEWLLAHGITHMIAKRGDGKSTVALDMAFHIACDLDWCGVSTEKGWKVIYICGEDDVGMRLNCRAWMKEHNCEPARGRFRVADDIIKINDQMRLNLRIKEMIDWAAGVPCVIILDTWQRATSGSSRNDQQEMDVAVENAEFMAEHLHGPLISCVHPPKDGRMTVVGSGVQEDTSTGIWELKDEGGIRRLSVNRIKGKGHGNYMRFEFKEIEFEETDKHGKPLSGLVTKKVGGSEDGDRLMEARDDSTKLSCWADIIWGCLEFPYRGNSFEHEAPDLTIPQISKFIDKIVHLAEDDSTQRGKDAVTFKATYMDRWIKTYPQIKKDESEFRKELERLFPRDNPPNALTSDGKRLVKYINKSSSRKKAKGAQKVFDIGDPPSVKENELPTE